MSAFAERLKELRKAAGITQSELADRLLTHPQTVSKWERGLSEPDISQLGAIAAELGVSLERLCDCREGDRTYTGSFEAARFGKAVADQRTARGESQEQLAAALQVSGDAVSRWERGITCPDIEQLSALSVHFGIPVSRLWCGVGKEEASAEPVSVHVRRRERGRLFAVMAAVFTVLLAALIFLAVFLPRALSQRVFVVTLDGEQFEVADGSWFTPETPSRRGYTFAGWTNENGEAVSFPCRIEEEVSFSSVFYPAEYAIDYWLNGGYFSDDAPHTFTVESGAVALPSPHKAGDTFEGWYLTPDYTGDPVSSVSCDGADLALYAKWEQTVYSVRYELCGGLMREENPQTVTSQKEETLAAPMREGYLFLGWYDAPDGGKNYQTVGGGNAKNLTLYAMWQKTDKLFTVYYVCDGEVPQENPVSVGAGEYHALLPAQKTGYDFLGWNTKADGSGEMLDALEAIDRTMCLYAIFSPKQYLIRYEYDGMYENGKVNPNYITYGERVVLQPVYLAGHEFDGWYTAPTGGTRISVIDEDNLATLFVLYARFVPCRYTIVLDAAGGTFVTQEGEVSRGELTVDYGEEAQLPVCTRAGYTFLGWKDEEGEWVERIHALNVRDMTLKAVWRASDQRYSIRYELRGGTLDRENPEEVLCGQTLYLNEPVRDGYLFLGWYDDPDGNGTRYTVTPADRESDLTLYAVWQEIVVSGSDKDFAYEISARGVTLTEYCGEYGENVDLEIPAIVRGSPVIGLECKFSNGAFRSVTLPDTLLSIGENVFEQTCIEETLVIPSSVHELGARCFAESRLNVTFEEGSALTEIPPYAFSDAVMTTPLELPYGIESIREYAFINFQSTGLVLPESLTHIYTYGVAKCSVPVCLPSSIRYLGPDFFTENVLYSLLTKEELRALGADIQFDVVCLSGKETTTLKDGASVQIVKDPAFVLPTPEKEGYTFLGWKNAEGAFVRPYYIAERSRTLYAVWEKESAADGRDKARPYLLSENRTNVCIPQNGTFYFKPKEEGDLVLEFSVEDFSEDLAPDIGYMQSVTCILIDPNGNEREIESGELIACRAGSIFRLEAVHLIGMADDVTISVHYL